MSKYLDMTLTSIGKTYAERLAPAARNYLEVDIGKEAAKLGLSDIEKRYRKVFAIIPLKKPGRGMKVRIDGRTFVSYGQLDSGVVIPKTVGQNCKMNQKAYIANDSMILNFE